MSGALWTDERFERAKALLNDGLSASEIATALGDGITRNMVIGKLNREGLPGGAGPRCKGSHKARPRRVYDHDAVLARWQAGEPEQLIGMAEGVPPKTVRRIVCEARQRGDPRAVFHGRFGPRKQKRVVSSPRSHTPRPVLVPIEDMVVPISLDVGILALTNVTCKWPVNEPPKWGTWLFCGHRNFNGLPYCEYHSRLAYRPPEAQRKRARDTNYFARL